MSQKILIICFTDISRDPRVRRQIAFLKDKYQLTVLGSGNPGIEGIEYLHCPFSLHTSGQKIVPFLLLAARQFERHYWRQSFVKAGFEFLYNRSFDLVIANEIYGLPLAVESARGARIIFDAHEHYPSLREDSTWWRLTFRPSFEYLLRTYLPKVDLVTTVSAGIAQEYSKCYGVKTNIITNVPEYHNIMPRATDGKKIRLIYHGLAVRTRKLENLIQTFLMLDERFELHLIFAAGSDSAYIQRLNRLAGTNNRIKFTDPVHPNQVVEHIAHYDIGIYLFEPTNFNNKMSLPNKFFEFIQARLSVAVGPSPEMSEIVSRHGLGVVSPSFAPADLARLLNGLSAARIDEFKHNSHKVALKFSAQSNRAALLDLVASLIGR